MEKIMFNDRYGLTEAVLSGRKTQTRRIVPQSTIDKYALLEDPTIIDDARYDVGEVVAVAQSYKDAGYSPDKVFYRSVPDVDGYRKELASEQAGWSNKMFVCANLMPHHIRITNVGMERLQDISDEDCMAEGIRKLDNPIFGARYEIPNFFPIFNEPREAYAALIDRISGKGTWNSNPYVFVYEFELA